MSAKILFLPGAQEQQLANRIVELGKLIRNDINRYLRYKDTEKEIPRKTQLLIKRTKQRMLSRLEKVAKVQQEQKLNNKEFETILEKALEKVDKHSPDFQKKYETLCKVFHDDKTITKVHFLQAFMHILAGVPENQVITPFKI